MQDAQYNSHVQQVIYLATACARRFCCGEVDTEHILLAVLSEQESIATAVLRRLKADPAEIKSQIECAFHWHANTLAVGALPLTKSAEMVVELAIVESQFSQHAFVATEHFLVALLSESNGLAARVLAEQGLTTIALRQEMFRVITDLKQTPDLLKQLAVQSGNLLQLAERDYIFAMYRLAVEFYKPKIENRTGVDLGNIAVWDYGLLHQHTMDIYRQSIGSRKVGLIKSIILKRRLRQFAESIQLSYAKHARNTAAAYYQDAIYVSLDSGACHDELLAAVVVHELAHALWERIAEIRLDSLSTSSKTYRMFFEGFATYAHQVWFLDLYPSSVRPAVQNQTLPFGSVYERGLRKVKSLVKHFGPDIILEIPKRWREF